MATFTVDPATLNELSCSISKIHSEMQSMHGVAKGYSGRIGGGDLEGQVESFCSHWGYGLSQISDHMRKIVAKLDAAAAVYEKSELGIGGACREGR